MEDSIERTTHIPVDIETVWEALTTAEGIRQWFGDEVEIDLRSGGEARFGWTGYGASSHAVVVDVDHPTRFSYRWTAGDADRADEGPSTLVEFTMAERDGGTEVRVRESGFASLPPEIIEQTFKENSSGWNAEIQDLRDYLVTVGA